MLTKKKDVIAFLGYTHISISLMIAWNLRHLLQPWGIIFCAIGSLLPDIDHPGSLLGRRMKVVSVIGLGHRGWTHSFLGFGIFTLLAYVIIPKYLLGFVIGYLSHLILDSLNPSGVAWLIPFSKKRFHIIGIPTNGLYELVFLALFVIYIWEKWTPVW